MTLLSRLAAALLALGTLGTLGTLTACTDADLQKPSPAYPSPDYPSPDYATAPVDLSSPQGTAHSMMMAMYRGDAELVDKVFIENATLRRVKADGVVQPDGLKRWRDWVGTLDVGQAHEEIFGLEVQRFGTLAAVWAPFVITYEGKIVGCGVNHLSMAYANDQWRVVSGMDTPAPKENCAKFKAEYLAGT
ncbi:MAG: hypothetical protein ABJN69_05195 [Hellea sp.]